MSIQPTPTTARLPGEAYAVADAFQRALDRHVDQANDAMLDSWVRSMGRTRMEHDLLLQKIARAREAGQPVSAAWLYQQDRLASTLRITEQQVGEFAQYASEATRQLHADAITVGTESAASMGDVALHESGAVSSSFTQIDPDTMRRAVGLAGDGSPLFALFSGLAGDAAQAAREVLVHGVTTGKGIDWMKRRLAQVLDVPRWRAETIARTEAQRIFRAAHRETYMANEALLEGWTWKAHLDQRTCSACVVMDGTLHPVGATLDGHPRCRCAMVPRTKSWDALGSKVDMGDTRPPVRSGKDWLAEQPDAVQRAIMGRGKHRAYKDGKLSLDDLVARTETPAWGTMRRERSLREIRDGVHPNTLPSVQRDVDAVSAPLADPAPQQFGSLLGGPDDHRHVSGPLSEEQWEEYVIQGFADSDYRYLPPGPDRAMGVLQYDEDMATWAKTVAANLRDDRPPFAGIDFDRMDSGKTAMEWKARPGYGRDDVEADLLATARWLNSQPTVPLGRAYRGTNFPPEMSWEDVKAALRTDDWDMASVSERQRTAMMYAGRPDRSRSVVWEVDGAEGVRIPGVGNFAHTNESLLSGRVRVKSMELRPDPDGWGERLYVRAEWERPSALPTPEPAYVERLAKALDSGDLTVDQLAKGAETASELGKANAQEAIRVHLARREAEAAARAARGGPLEFRSAQEARDWADGVWAGPDGYPADELKVLRDYTASAYGPMNNTLRSGKGKRLNEKIRTMDKAMDRAPRVPDDIQVIRNANLRQLGITASRTDPRTVVGRVLEEHGYLSTSVNRTGAMQGEVRLAINVPKGSRAIYVSGKGGPKSPNIISDYGGGESELILDRGGHLTIKSVRKVGKRWHVEADWTPREGVR